MSLEMVASLQHTISSHTSDINGVAFSKDKKLATCSGDKTVRLWNITDYSEDSTSPLCGHNYYVHCCMFSPFGTLLATCSTDGKLIVWEVKSGKKQAVFQHESKSPIRTCKFSPNSLFLVSGGDDNNLCLWDVKAKIMVRKFQGHEATVFALDFTPDSQHIVSGSSDGDLQVWDAVYGHGKALMIELEGHDLGVTSCEFSPTFGIGSSQTSNHYLLASTGQDDLVKLWDFMSVHGSTNVSLRQRHVLHGHTGSVSQCKFSLNGRLLASTSFDKTVRLWDPIAARILHVIEAHKRYVTCCAFSSDGQYLATGSNDKTVMIWKLTTEQQLINDLANEDTDHQVSVSQDGVAAKKKPEDWTVDDVAQWIQEIGLEQYRETFQQNHIDGQELFTLNQETLQTAMGIDALGHRNKILRSRTKLLEHPIVQKKEMLDNGVPDEYLCPITFEIMKDPVISSDGYTYERSAIESWMKSGKDRSPMTNAVLSTQDLTPNRSLKMLIQRYLNP